MADKTRHDLFAVGGAAVLVAAAVAVGTYFNRPGSDVVIWAFAPPLYGNWLPRISPASFAAVAIAAVVVLWGPTLAQRLSWRPLLAAGYAVAAGWTMALALVDGFRTGFADRLESDHEYLREVPGITDIPAMLREFTSRILDFQPDSWTTHVSGHPPGATLVFVWLDRLGLGGGTWAAVVCVLVGCLFAVAVPVTVSALGCPEAARVLVPFAVLFPGAIWLGVSADGLFAGFTATGIALLAVAGRGFADGRRYAGFAAVASGLVLGFGIFLSYGLVLLGVVALAVTVVTRGWRAFLLAVLAALTVVAVFALAGFWWLDGYHLVVERYYQGIATQRPYSYWTWANLACLVLATGPAVVAGYRRAVHSAFLSSPRGWNPLVVLGLAALVVIAFADLSGLSKAETERIWLPFAVWLLPVTALLPRQGARWWLAAQAVLALAVNHLVFTFW